MKHVLSSCSAALAAACCLSACTAVHPLPEDVTDITVTIVQKIRCEARDAVMTAIIGYLKDSPHVEDQRFAERLKTDSSAIAALIDSTPGLDISGDAYAYLNQYYTGAIAYEFDLDIQREADNAIGISLVDAFTNNERRYDIGGGIKREQKARRQFQIADRFVDLARLYRPDKRGNPNCVVSSPINQAYPISGKVGLTETVSTFLQLNDMAGVQQSENKAAVTRFTDELLFTTTLEGRLNPKIVFDPIGIGKTNPEAGLTNTYKRIDKHQVTVSIEVPIKPDGGDEKFKTRENRRNPASAAVRSSRSELQKKAERQALRNLNLKRQLDFYKTVEDLEDKEE